MKNIICVMFEIIALLALLGCLYDAVNAAIRAENIMQQIFGTANLCAALLAMGVIVLCEMWSQQER